MNSLIKTEDWVASVVQEIQSRITKVGLSDGNYSLIKGAVPLLNIWLLEYYAGRQVPSPWQYAVDFFESSAFIVREDEDEYLMKELEPVRSSKMTDDEWYQYCQAKGAIFGNNEIAFLNDGTTDS